MTIATAVQAAIITLTGHSKSPRLDAEVLLAFILKSNKTAILTHPEKKLSSTQIRRYRNLIKRRQKRIPIPYLTGTTEFFGLQYRITPAVLVPRPFTELLIEQLLIYLKSLNFNLTIADIGTGSGAIALSLASQLPQANILATDISPAALRVAKKNASALHLTRRVTFLKGTLLQPLAKKYHPTIIVANLPYLTQVQLLEPSIRREPKLALYGGKQGLNYIRNLILQATNIPSINTIALEFDPPQYKAICTLLKQWSKKVSISPISDGKKVRGLIATR